MGAPSLPETWKPFLKDHRLATFKNWPFLEGCACTPEQVRLRGLAGPAPDLRPRPPAGSSVGSRGPGRAPPGSEPCSPLQMAAAGFVHCPTENEPDLAQCFLCFKELEGWEPDDDPM